METCDSVVYMHILKGSYNIPMLYYESKLSTGPPGRTALQK